MTWTLWGMREGRERTVRWRRWRCAALAVLAAGVLSGCEGRFVDPVTGEPGGASPPPGALVESPAPSARVARLTHSQWANSVQALLRLDAPPTGLAQELRADPAQSGFLFDNQAQALTVDEVLWSAYQRVATTLAEQVVADPAQLARILPPPAATDEARARAFVESFGLRAHRRPLTAEEVEASLALYRKGPGAYAELPTFEAGIRLLLEAFLQSPHFLYRVERSVAQQGGRVPLDGYELASRLSFALWGSIPDDALMDAARDGSLRDPVVAAGHARRMLQDAGARGVVNGFHRAVFDVPRFAGIRPSPSRFPGVSSELAEHAARENALFVEDVVFARQGGYAELLTSPQTFVNDELARIYGLPGTFGASFVPVTLDVSRRRGVLTQVGFLASHATSMDPDPIHRGVFLAERILCLRISAPPNDIPPLPPAAGRTNRQVVEAHTQAPGSTCAGCHSQTINPLGFPFESYDAVGAFRTEDNGHPVDASAAPYLGGEQVSVRGAVELAEALAGSRAAHECYARRWLEYLHGRPATEEDQPVVERLGRLSQEGTLPVLELVVGLVTSEGFLNRSTEELP